MKNFVNINEGVNKNTRFHFQFLFAKKTLKKLGYLGGPIVLPYWMRRRCPNEQSEFARDSLAVPRYLAFELYSLIEDILNNIRKARPEAADDYFLKSQKYHPLT